MSASGGDPSSLFQREPGAAPLPPDVVRQAATHLVQLQSSPGDPGVADACTRWRAAHPHHEAAWQRVCALLAMPGAATNLQGSAARSAIEHVARQRGRRRFLALGLTAGGAGAMAWSLESARPMRATFADYRSSTGERREIALDDGTLLLMNTGTALDVRDEDGLRRVILLAGEVMVTSGTQAGRRTLRVDTRYGTVSPVGTRFSVRDTGEGHARVALFEGLVRLQPRNGQAVLLEAGQGAELHDDSVTSPAGLDLSAESWTRGVLMAERMPLAQCLSELARYRRGIVRCDPDVAQLPISGTYPLDRTDQALSLIGRVLDLRITYRTRYWVSVGRK
ncbi:MAG: FecR domain-containing protein [Achromobacter marplatensis]|uniref:FecR domain-containing protein n=1 Tax=Achromobacter marplatensis TaxID=470868 RepID=UPI003D03ACF5